MDQVERRPINDSARLGTNLLRDVLVRLPGLGTWPRDEINCSWRHCNLFFPTDELSPGQATSAVRLGCSC